MRPRPARPSPRAPLSPGASARVRPLGPLTYRAQADPEGLRATALPGQPADWRARARGGPSVQEHFFGRHDIRLLPPDSSPRPSRTSPHSLPVAAGGGRLGQALLCSQLAAGGGGAHSSHLSPAGGVRPAEPSHGPALSAPLQIHGLPELPQGRTEIWRPPDSRSLIPAPN